MGKQLIPLCWLAEELDDNGETILTGRLGRGRLVARLMPRDDELRLWAVALAEQDPEERSRQQYAKRKRGSRA